MKYINLNLGETDKNCLNRFVSANDSKPYIDCKNLLSAKNNGNLDGKKIISSMLPKGEYKVFISHSHKDVKLASCLARYIERSTYCKCFIDSEVWGNMDSLQDEWDNRCLYTEDIKGTKKQYYNHKDVLMHSTNTRMMLATSLLTTIKECDIFIFLNTNNSASTIKRGELDTTSPWLYFELTAADVFDKESMLYHFDDSLDESVDYTVSIKSMQEVKSLKALISYIGENNE